MSGNPSIVEVMAVRENNGDEIASFFQSKKVS